MGGENSLFQQHSHEMQLMSIHAIQVLLTARTTSIILKHKKNEMKVNYTWLSWSKQLCFIDKVLRRVSFQWMYKNHPLIILIWYIMTSSTSLFTVRGIHYCYCCWDLGQKYLCFQTKNSQKQQTGDWYCRYGILECHKTLE